MLDKNTVLSRKNMSYEKQKKVDDFFCCLEKTKNLPYVDKDLKRCIERVLDKKRL